MAAAPRQSPSLTVSRYVLRALLSLRSGVRARRGRSVAELVSVERERESDLPSMDLFDKLMAATAVFQTVSL